MDIEKPQPVLCWWHVIWNTYGTWLPGDPRGFRSRGHRIHSGGDYKHRPPEGEHAELHRYHQARASTAVRLTRELRPLVAEAVLEWAGRRDVRVAALGVGADHVHGLIELPGGYGEVKRLVGHAKTISSRGIGDAMPGRVWSRGCHLVRVRDRSQQVHTFRYITQKQGRGTWVWEGKRGGRWLG